MLSVRGDDRLQAVVLALRAARRDVRNEVNKQTRQVMNPVWRDLVAQNARTRQDTKVIARGARIAAGNPPAAIAATSNRPLSGGLVASEYWHAIEFGGRHPGIPPRYRTGRVAYPALTRFAPRLVSLWVQTVVRTFAEAVEKGN